MSGEYGYQWRAHIEDSGFTDGLRVFIAQDQLSPGSPTKVKIWKLRQFKEITEGDQYPEPTLQGPRRVIEPFIQALVDEAWRHGIRPTALKLCEAETSAQRSHLNDMRAIVATHLKVKLP